MSLTLVIRPEAEADALEAFRWYNDTRFAMRALSCSRYSTRRVTRACGGNAREMPANDASTLSSALSQGRGGTALLLVAALALSDAFGATDAEFDARRRAMVEEITAEQSGLPGPFDTRVKDAMARVPRHL